MGLWGREHNGNGVQAGAGSGLWKCWKVDLITMTEFD